MRPFSYDQANIHLRYDRARNFSAETINLWLTKLSQHLPRKEINSIVDLGCGTGRFSDPLGSRFAATVYGIDLSAKMLSVARMRTSSPSVKFIQGSAEKIPLKGDTADLIFLSMVYHHIQDKTRARDEWKRILKQQGRLAIRTSTQELMASYLWLSFFPEARDIEARRTPSRRELTSLLHEHGFKLEAHEIVCQVSAKDLDEYYEKISLRGLSSLQAISDQAFERGLSMLQKHCNSRKFDQPIEYEIDLFVFSKN